MKALSSKATLGEAIPGLLEARGIDTVFGIPGVHTVELYRGLARSRLTHVTPRHEQGAGFMADGYARVSGRPAACFVVTGPGLLNIATAMGQAFADSVPMLVFATLNSRSTLERGEGRLHELRGQSRVGRELAAFSQVILSAHHLIPALDEAFGMFVSQRPGPALIEIPIDLLSEPFEVPERDRTPASRYPSPPFPDPSQVSKAAELLNESTAPLVFLGGGAARGASDIRQLVEALDAPALASSNGKGILPSKHPLRAGGCMLTAALRANIRKADAVLAIGTELSETDLWHEGENPLRLDGSLIRVDIDAHQLGRNVKPNLAIWSEARAFAKALLPLIDPKPKDGARRAQTLLESGLEGADPRFLKLKPVIDNLWEILPDAIVVGDSTALSYTAGHMAAPPAPRRWMSAATGFGTLGYGLPAAIGAKVAKPDAPVICLIGDGGLHYTLPELAAAMDAKAPVIVLLWNDHKYGEIETYMIHAKVETIGINLYPTDFSHVAMAFGAAYAAADNLSQLTDHIRQAATRSVSTIIEMNANRYVS